MRLGDRALLWACAVLAAAAAGIAFFHYMPDDAWLQLRYARNLAAGEGMVFNPGEPVEGYSGFLWIVILASAARLGLPLAATARVSGLLLSIAALPAAAAAAASRPRGPGGGRTDPAALFAAPLVIAASIPWAVWAMSGSEVPLYTFLAAAGTALVVRRRPAAAQAAVFSLLALVRWEGLLLLGASLVIAASGERGRREALRGAGVAALLLVPYAAWKVWWFGSLVPNRVYAASGPPAVMLRNGLVYAGGFLARYGWIAAAGTAMAGRDGLRERRILVPLAFVALLLIAAVASGGDPSPQYRLLVPAVVLSAVILAAGLDRLVMRLGTARAAPTVLAVAFAFAVMVPGSLSHDTVRRERVTVEAFARLGGRLGAILPPGAVIACGSTGAIGFHSGLRVIDILGYTEPVIAREGRAVSTEPGRMKSLGARVMAARPDLLLLGNIQIHRGERDEDRGRIKPQERDILEQPLFIERYRFVNLPIGGGFYLSCYAREGADLSGPP